MFRTFEARLSAVAIACIALSLSLVALISQGFFLSSIQSGYTVGYSDYTETMRESLDTLLETTLAANSYFLFDPEMQSVYDQIRNLKTLADYRTITEGIDRLIGQRLLLHPADFLDISILTSDFIYNRSTVLNNFFTPTLQELIFEQTRNVPGRFVEISTTSDNTGNRQPTAGITFAGLVPNPDPENKEVLVILTIKPGVVLSDTDALDIAIVDGNGRSIWRFHTLIDPDTASLAPQQVGQVNPGRQSNPPIADKELVFYARSRSRDWIYVFLFESEGWREGVKDYTSFLLISNFLLFIVFGFLAVVVTHTILRPLHQLRDAAGEVARNPRISHPARLQKVLKRISIWPRLRTTIVLLLGAITILASGTSILFSQISARERLTARIEASALSNLYQRKQNIRLVMNQVERQSAFLAVSASLQDIDKWSERGDSLRIEIDEVIANQRVFVEGVFTIDLYSRFGTLLYTNRSGSTLNSLSTNSLGSIPEIPQGNTWLSSRFRPIDNETISFVRHIRSKNDLIDLGFLFVGVDGRSIAELAEVSSGRPTTLSFLVDEDSNILAHQDRRLQGSSLTSLFTDSSGNRDVEIEGQSYRYFSMELERGGWRLVDFIPGYYISSNLETFTGTVILAILPVIFLMLWAIGIISGRLSLPLEGIARHIEQVSFTVLGNQTYSHSGDEIHQLASAFDTMLSRLNNLIEENYLSKIHERELEARRKAAELKALQFQINPHFLYNTFASVGFLIKLGEADSAIQMVNALVTLFRKAASSAQVITVAEEVAYVDAYLTIIRLRHNGQIQCSVSISPDIKEASILKFTLQPLIENAVMHGMLEGTGSGNIELRGDQEGDRIVFTVIDDGIGVPAHRLEEIHHSLADLEHGKAVGMTNVLERLRLYFGDTADISIVNGLERGCIVSITIPFQSIPNRIGDAT